jgi:metallo-beta-lactamase family protein
METTMKLHFLGANRQVTGSRYLLEAGGLRIMIDCGMFQERDCLDRNWNDPPFAADEVDELLLTHAHLDHCGLLPRFVNHGYRGRILATPPTLDLARIVLEDSARIQKEDAAYKRRRHEREGRSGPHPVTALYSPEDAAEAISLFRLARYDTPIELNDAVRVHYREAGHILGSSMLEIEVDEGGQTRTVLFSGDIGQPDRPLIHDPWTPSRADYLVMESTYGDRDHERDGDVLDQLAGVINDTVARGGNILIPTFAIDRAQEMLYLLSRLVIADRIPRLTTFLDSPMAVNATTVYKRYKYLLDDETQALLKRGEHPFQFDGLHLVRGSRESRAINSIRGSCIIMSSAGMCTGGRIKHHLRQNIGRSESTVLFVGYQARGTLGRHIIEGDEQVRIHGRQYEVKARIDKLNGLSAHGDRTALLEWVDGFAAPPRRVFLTHGEERAAEALREAIEQREGWNASVPEYEDVVELD